MFRAFVELTLAALPPFVFITYCRSLLVQASKIELSADVLEAIPAESGDVSAEDFPRLQALVRLCPLCQKDRVPLAAVSAYFFLLKGLYAIASPICDLVANWTEGERQRCSYFAAVSLDRRIANARTVWAEQMVHSEEQSKPSIRSS